MIRTFSDVSVIISQDWITLSLVSCVFTHYGFFTMGFTFLIELSSVPVKSRVKLYKRLNAIKRKVPKCKREYSTTRVQCTSNRGGYY